MPVHPQSELWSQRRTEEELRALTAAIAIAKILRPLPCPLRQDVERKVREIIQ